MVLAGELHRAAAHQHAARITCIALHEEKTKYHRRLLGSGSSRTDVGEDDVCGSDQRGGRSAARHILSAEQSTETISTSHHNTSDKMQTWGACAVHDRARRILPEALRPVLAATDCTSQCETTSYSQGVMQTLSPFWRTCVRKMAGANFS